MTAPHQLHIFFRLLFRAEPEIYAQREPTNKVGSGAIGDRKATRGRRPFNKPVLVLAPATTG